MTAMNPTKGCIIMILAMALCIVMLGGCAGPKSHQEAAVSAEQMAIAAPYFGLLDDLTSLMQKDLANPGENLVLMRDYIGKNGAKAAQILNKFNQDMLGLDETQRAVWRRQMRPELEQRLDAYAHAQLALQKKLNDSQKWELGEILAQLK